MPESLVVRRLARAIEKFYESDRERFAGFSEGQMNTALARELVGNGWIDDGPRAVPKRDESPKLQFVVFDASGTEVDWVDPYVSHKTLAGGVYEVTNDLDSYRVRVPDGGRFEIRPVDVTPEGTTPNA